jgi:hypothetical protein
MCHNDGDYHHYAMTKKIISLPEYNALLLMHPYEIMHEGTSMAYRFRGLAKTRIYDAKTVIQVCPRDENEPLQFQIVKHDSVQVINGKTLWKPDKDFENSEINREIFGNYTSIEYAHDGEFLYVEIHDPIEQMTFILTNTNYEAT